MCESNSGSDKIEIIVIVKTRLKIKPENSLFHT
jgi:hypothetical protein